MAKLRYINTHFWDDTYTVNLDPVKKLLFLYLLTNPLTNLAGAYEISLRRISFDTGISAEKVGEILAEFESAGKIFYRDGWVLILNFIKNQSNNPKMLKGVEDIVKCCPDWIKDRLSIAYDSLSHLILFNRDRDRDRDAIPHNINSPSANPEENTSPLFDEFQIKTEEYLSAVKEIYRTTVLSREDRWADSVGKAILGEIPLDHYLAALKMLLKEQTNPKYPVTPEQVLTAAIEHRRKAVDAPPPIITVTAAAPVSRAAEIADMEARGFTPMAVIGGSH